MSVIWEQLAKRVDEAHMERDREILQQFDDAWAAQPPVMVDNGPVLVAWLIPLTIGALLGALLHMVWVGVRG